jgi:hypothetical protein
MAQRWSDTEGAGCWREPHAGEPLLGRRVRVPSADGGDGVVWSIGAGWVPWETGPSESLVGKRVRVQLREPATGAAASAATACAAAVSWREGEVLQQLRKLFGPDQHAVRFDATTGSAAAPERVLLVQGDAGQPAIPFEVLHTGPHVLSVQYDTDPQHRMHVVALGAGLQETAGVRIWDPVAAGSSADSDGVEMTTAQSLLPDCPGFLADCGTGLVDPGVQLRHLASGRGDAFGIRSMLLVPLAQLVQLRRFPRPDEVRPLDDGELTTIAEAAAHGRGRVVFVSHTWPHPTAFPDTPDHSQAGCLLQWWETQQRQDSGDSVHFFIDCSCIEPLLSTAAAPSEGVPGDAGNLAVLRQKQRRRQQQLLSLPVYLRCASEFVCIIDAAASAAATARGLSGGGSSSSGARGCWDWCRYELENFAADPSAPRTILTTDPTAGTAIASFAVHGRSAARQLQDKGLLPKSVEPPSPTVGAGNAPKVELRERLDPPDGGGGVEAAAAGSALLLSELEWTAWRIRAGEELCAAADAGDTAAAMGLLRRLDEEAGAETQQVGADTCRPFQRHVNVLEWSDRNGRRPLHHAALQDDAELARALIARGAELLACDGEGRTAWELGVFGVAIPALVSHKHS